MRALIGTLLLGTALASPASAVAQLLSPNPTILTLRADGLPADSSDVFFSAMTPNLRYFVVFGGRAQDFLGPAAPPGSEVAAQWILFDRQSNERRVVSINASGVAQNLGGSMASAGFAISISDDANRIIFNSTATNLDPAATSGGRHCYLWDRAVGHAVALDVDPLPGLQARPCGNITADGREVVALCSQPVSGVTGLGICVRDLDTGSIQRLAVGRGAVLGVSFESFTRISADGQVVAFSGWAGTTPVGLTRLDRGNGEVTDVIPTPNAPTNIALSADGRYLAYNIGVYDHATGSYRTVSRPPLQFPTRIIFDLSISRDGRFATFRTSAAEFERPFTGLPFGTGRIQVYRLDLATDRLDLVSRVGGDGPIANSTHDGCENPSPFPCPFNRFSPRISADGRHVVFQFPRSNLAPSYPPGDPAQAQLFIKDLGPAPALAEPVPVPLERHWLAVLMAPMLLLGMFAAYRRMPPD